MKKVVSFLLILLLVCLAAWFVFGDFLTATLFTGGQRQQAQYYALTQDGRGSVYYAQNAEGVNRLTAIDSSGNVLLDEDMGALRNAEDWHIDGLYVASNNTILAAASRYERTTEKTGEISLHCFYENGSYKAMLLSAACDQSPYAQGEDSAFFSAISESDDKLIFGLYQGGRIHTYELDKGSTGAEPTLMRDISVGFPISDFIVMPEQRIVCVARSGDLITYEPSSISGVKRPAEGVIVDALFHVSADAVYCRDARSGGVYLLDARGGSLARALNGTGALDASGADTFNDIRLMHVNPDGRVAGILQSGGGERIVAGSELYMASLSVSGEESGLESLLLVIAICAGALLLTVLLWDAYCRLLKMRLPIMLRQALLIIVGVFTLIYFLLSLVVEPRMRAALSDQYESRIRSAAEVAAATVNEATDAEAERSIAFIGGAANTDDAMPPIHFDLFTIRGEEAYLLVSGDGMPPGANANHIKNRAPLTAAVLQAMQAGSATLRTSETTGERAYVLLALEQNRVLAASSGIERINENIDSITGAIINFLIIGGVALIALLLLIESITVLSLLRLKRGVDAVSAGDYDVSIRVHSGDEVENLANSFNTMTRLIRGSMQRLNRMNASAARFVPSNMVSLLGVGSVEALDRGACVKERMTIMLARFRFLGSDGSESTDLLFDNINQVMQALTSAVPENNGAVYDLRADGFNAVFATNAADAIRAALKLRANAEAFNEERRAKGQSTADVRLVLTVGDVMLGVVGDDTRLSPTAISDVIVSAGQIMEIAEPSNIYVCCTGALAEEMAHYRSRYVGVFETGRGSEQLYDLYEGDPLALVKHKQMCAQMFDAAVAAFYDRDFAGAKIRFMELIKLSLQDKTSVNYMYFADRYMREAPEQVSYHAMPR